MAGRQVFVPADSVSEIGHGKTTLRRRAIGYVFQDFNLLPGLTAAENVSLPLELDGLSARKARVPGLRGLERLGLGKRAAHYPDQLSGGERQRVSIARAMVGERRLLLEQLAPQEQQLASLSAELHAMAVKSIFPRIARVARSGDLLDRDSIAHYDLGA